MSTDQQTERVARVERVARAMRATRECQAGMSFGVPPAARDQFVRALAAAAVAVLWPEQAEIRRCSACGADCDRAGGVCECSDDCPIRATDERR